MTSTENTAPRSREWVVGIDFHDEDGSTVAAPDEIVVARDGIEAAEEAVARVVRRERVSPDDVVVAYYSAR